MLDQFRLIPLASPRDAAETDALIGGIRDIGIVEVALRTPYAPTALRAAASRADLVVGAGTVLNREQALSSIDAGARFLVSPGLDAAVVRVAQEAGIPVLPGVATPSEVMAARNLGVHTVKVFPAAVLGGLSLIDAFAAVFDDITYVPSGGVDETNLAEHLAHRAVAAVSGSWICSAERLRAGHEAVAEAALRALRIVEASR